VPPDLLGHGAGKLIDRGFRGGIGKGRAERIHPGNRGNENHIRARARFFIARHEKAHRLAGKRDGTREILFEVGFPVFIAHIIAERGAAKADIGNDAVKGAEMFFARNQRFFQIARIRHVPGNGQHGGAVITLFGERGFGCIEACFPAPRHHHFGAFRQKTFRHAEPDPAGGPGNENHFVFESQVHG
jgi:hypothetical protein